MGLILEEKTRRNIEDGKRAIFTLSAYTDDFHPNNDEGCYTCTIQIFDPNNNIVDEFYRHFLVNDFNDKYYKHFILKFSRDIDYREQFNIKNDIVEKRNKNEIDEELVNIIAKLNLLGLRTEYSCQGTKTPWMDRPHKSDGHSITAYITFVDKLPNGFIQLANKFECIVVDCMTIRSKRRDYNILFPGCMTEIIDKWETTR
ncbi:hypothetical protein [Cohnella silvisoli]|uniref:Uncharacterized protein n=1 Tax=Cohnella silvisoli TaxID=2873699 RepID=A0ABV1L291_9BACL|nr:hypothetical protein [Cohnella silvisoli]MCD9025446.1 hypothetical protein [Cohnella silvisoli]